MNDRQLPPGDRADAPIPPPRLAVARATHLEIDRIGIALAAARVHLAVLIAAVDSGDGESARAASIALLAALKPDPRVLALRVARTLAGAAA